MIRTIKKWLRKWRSAITGRYVTEEYAEANPSTTIEEKEQR